MTTMEITTTTRRSGGAAGEGIAPARGGRRRARRAPRATEWLLAGAALLAAPTAGRAQAFDGGRALLGTISRPSPMAVRIAPPGGPLGGEHALLGRRALPPRPAASPAREAKPAPICAERALLGRRDRPRPARPGHDAGE